MYGPRRLTLLACVAAAVSGCGALAERARPPGRLAVAVLPFRDRTGDPQAAHWEVFFGTFLERELHHLKAIRFLPTETLLYAARQAKTEKNPVRDHAQVRLVGELAEAQRVVWGEYRRDGSEWAVSARVLNVATGRASRELRAKSADWFEVRDRLVTPILDELGVAPSDPERATLGRRATTSTVALEAYAKGYAAWQNAMPSLEVERLIRDAMAADSEFVEAWIALGAVWATQGAHELAEFAARKAVKKSPDSAKAHQVLGISLMLGGKLADAEGELRTAERLNPDDADTAVRLGEACRVQGKIDEAIGHLQRAVRLNPRSAGTHANLGFSYSIKADRDRGLAALEEAERLQDSDDAGASQMLSLGYDQLGETARAVEHHERFLAAARKQGTNPRLVRRFEERHRELKARLKPAFLDLTPPEAFTQENLRDELRRRLTPEELEWVENPLEDAPELRAWARELAAGAEGEMGKARGIFEALTRRIERRGTPSARTAREVFVEWSDPSATFNCQEYSKLFIALARSVGVQAYYVHLEKDYSGRAVSHDCAAVFAEGRALLVDPAYRWFGVPHQEYQILNDVEAIAHHLFQGAGADQVARCRVAAKLHPGFAWGLKNLAGALTAAGDWEGAREAIQEAARSEPDRWYVRTALGVLALRERNAEEAGRHFYAALAAHPEDAEAHFHLAHILLQEGKPGEAREEFRRSLQADPPEERADEARRHLAEINEQMGAE